MKYKLADVVDIIGGGTPKTTKEEYWNGTIPWLSVKDFNNDQRYVYTTEKSITELGLENSSTKLLQKDDIIISARGTVGELAMIPFSMAFNQSCYGLRARKQIIEPVYLYYLLKYHIKTLKTNTHGSVFDTITRDTFSSVEVDIAALDDQNDIALILSSLDDKIELNIKINANLQQQAQAIFKSWFVDFELFGGTRPEDWNFICLEDCCSLITRGIAPKYDDTTDQIVLNQKCIRNQQIDLSKARKHRPQKVNEKWLQHGDILINSTGQGTLGRIAQVHFQPQNMTVDSHVTIVRPKHELLVYYLGCLLTGREYEFVEMERGSTGQTELPRESVQKYEVLLPDNAILKRFNDLMRPIFQLLVQNQEESLQLAELRDALLPKLMSGELFLNEEVGS